MPPKRAPSKSKSKKKEASSEKTVPDSTNAAMVDGVIPPMSFREMELDRQLSILRAFWTVVKSCIL